MDRIASNYSSARGYVHGYYFKLFSLRHGVELAFSSSDININVMKIMILEYVPIALH